jgi:F-type H+-transporting ATPase subunit a
MGPHDTWFHLIPGVKGAEASAAKAVGNRFVSGAPVDDGLGHVMMALWVVALLVVLGSAYKKALAKASDGGVVPSRKLDARGLVDVLCDAAMGIMVPVMGPAAARKFLPMIGTLGFFILFSNLMGLVPGFVPATDKVSTTLACSIIVFVATHWYGIKANGMGHIKHMMGPVWWLAPLMLVIETISHIVRPLSLALRLMGNMVGDHMVLGIFLGLVPLLVPIPIILLGSIVCVVQALVFCLLSVVYIGMAIEDQHHEEHGDDHGHDHGEGAVAHAH